MPRDFPETRRLRRILSLSRERGFVPTERTALLQGLPREKGRGAGNEDEKGRFRREYGKNRENGGLHHEIHGRLVVEDLRTGRWSIEGIKIQSQLRQEIIGPSRRLSEHQGVS